jgi:hypothetical protein
MTTYYLQTKNGHLFIDDKAHHEAEIEKTTEADSWIEAKKNFRFDLTVDQVEMLKARTRKAA